MRILHLLASPFFSGPAENVVLLAREQRELGHEVSVAADRKRPGLGAEEPLVPRLAAAGLLDDGGLELSVKSSPIAVLGDLRRLRRRRVEVVHAHFSHDHLLARWGRPPSAVLVRSLHAARSIRWSLPRADAYTVPTEALRHQLGREPTAVLPALVDPAFRPALDREALRREHGVVGEPVVGMISTFQPSRRHQVGIEAFARLRCARPKARMVLVGDGVLERELREQVRALGLDGAVTFAGYQSGPAFVRWLQVLDQVWILGLGNDHSGRAALQARATGATVCAVGEGALPSLAHAVVDPSPAAVAAAALQAPSGVARWPPNEEIARSVLALYTAAGAGR